MTKRLITALAFLFVGGAIALCAQDLVPDKNKKNKWGYLDPSGQKVIDYKFDEALAFVDGRAKVRKGDKWGYINTLGEEVIKVQFTEMGVWKDGECKVAVGGKNEEGVLKNAKYGFINQRGEYLLKPEYEQIGVFDENNMSLVKKGGKYGYINRSYDFVIPCKYTAIGKFNEQGKCWVYNGGKIVKGGKLSGGKYGVYDKNGSIVIKPNYKRIGTFRVVPPTANPIYSKAYFTPEFQKSLKEKQKEISKKLMGKSFLAGFTGDTESLMDDAKNQTKRFFEEVLNSSNFKLSEADNRLISECDNYPVLGHEFVSPEMGSTFDFSKSDYYAVSNVDFIAQGNDLAEWNYYNKKLEKVGIIDAYGKVVLKPGTYEIALHPNEGFIPVAKVKDKYLEVNYVVISTGKLLFKKWVKAIALTPFVNGMAIIAGTDGQYLINKNGMSISSNYDMIIPQDNCRSFIIERNGKYGLLNENGNEVLATDWSMILPIKSNLMCSRKEANGLIGYIDNTGKFVIDPQYVEARSFQDSSAGVKTDAGWGLIGTNGNSLVACAWSDVKSVSSSHPNIAWVKQDNEWQCVTVGDTNAVAFDGKFTNVTNFDESGRATVKNSKGLYGSIAPTGKEIVPAVMSSPDIVSDFIDYMTENSLNEVKAIDAYRFNVKRVSVTNKVHLSDRLSNEMWDF